MNRHNVRDLRRANRARLLRRLWFHGPLSRQELIAATGLSAASVSNVVSELLDAGLVVEAGAMESDGGRPRILLRIAADRQQVVGVDVGETMIRVERFDLALTEQARTEIPVPAGRLDPEAVVRGIRDGLGQILDPDGPGLLGVGIGVPGIVQHTPEAVVHGQTVGWQAVPFEKLLRESLRESGEVSAATPIHVDNGATTMGQAEMWFGAGRGIRNAAFLLLGSGVGASVITDGAPYRGLTTSAGEWGHTNSVIGGRLCRCGASGCLEAYISGPAVAARYAEAAGDAPGGPVGSGGSGQPGEHGGPGAASGSGGPGAGEEPCGERDLRAILAAAEAGDRVAREVLDETAVHIGTGIANLVNLFNPERVIIGGWAGLLIGRRLLDPIREIISRQALVLPREQATIGLSDLGPDAVARGAATLPVSRFLDSGGVPTGS
ncbi:ROK family transcriptional regulator [Phaeacidiphilus oryzae]|uniref:ROK family transcriptional regulator n=1 Tax=Phaeacidiphilus oryzae TaxID=348818 RepID=UPI00056263C1|nr:ROK family transcriptional regulator [Phaeacidiphilus oryzae]